MMAGLGKGLVVNLVATTDKFRKGMNDAKGILGGFGSGIKSTIRAVTGFKAALAGLAAAAGVGVGFSKLIDNINRLDAVAKTAARTGLSGEFLQKLEFAADQSGVSAEGLTNSIQKMTMAVGNGSKAFSEIGINIDQLKTLSPEQQFLKVAEQISKFPTAADRASAAFKVFGKGGIEMIPLLNNGMSGLNDLMAEAASLNIGLSAEELQSIEAANDAWGRMKAGVGAIWDQITVAMAPALTAVATAIGDVIMRFDGVSSAATTVINLMADWAVSGINYMEDFATVARVLAENYQQVWQVALENLPKIAKATFDWIVGNTQVAMNNMLTGVQNVWAKIEHKSQQLGEWIAYQTGMSDEMLDIAAPKMQQFQAFTGFQAPDWSESAVDLGTKITDAIAQNEQERQDLATKRESEKTKISDLTPIEFTAGEFGEGIGDQAKVEPVRLAGAMVRGSTEAYSTIVQAMVSRTKDPVVTATEKSSKAIVKAVKESKPVFNLVEAFGFV